MVCKHQSITLSSANRLFSFFVVHIYQCIYRFFQSSVFFFLRFDGQALSLPLYSRIFSHSTVIFTCFPHPPRRVFIYLFIKDLTKINVSYNIEKDLDNLVLYLPDICPNWSQTNIKIVMSCQQKQCKNVDCVAILYLVLKSVNNFSLQIITCSLDQTPSHVSVHLLPHIKNNNYEKWK